MCIGIPMQVLEVEGMLSLCEGMGRRQHVDTLLIDTPKPGDWVLVFLNSAREIIDEAQARTIADALTAVNLALQGETSLDHLFPDLAGREPELPAFLRADADKKE
jgi:hydrogenase expression/formation protein HypC